MITLNVFQCYTNCKKNIFKIVNSVILTNTSNLFFCSNILKFKDLIM